VGKNAGVGVDRFFAESHMPTDLFQVIAELHTLLDQQVLNRQQPSQPGRRQSPSSSVVSVSIRCCDTSTPEASRNLPPSTSLASVSF